jgi:hypothetical protein
MEIEADKKEQEIGKLEDEKKKEEAQLERARVVEREAREKYEEAKKNKQSLVHEIVLPERKCYLFRNTMRYLTFSEFNAPEIVWQATKFSWSWFWTRGASQDARSAQDEAEQRQRAAEAFEVLISDAQVDLSYKNAKFGDLVSKLYILRDTSNLTMRTRKNARRAWHPHYVLSPCSRITCATWS